MLAYNVVGKYFRCVLLMSKIVKQNAFKTVTVKSIIINTVIFTKRVKLAVVNIVNYCRNILSPPNSFE